MKLSNLQKKESSLGRRYYTLELVYNLFKGVRGDSIVQVGCQSRDSEYANFDLFDIFAYLNDTSYNSTYSVYCNEHNKEERKDYLKRKIYKDHDPAKIEIKELKEYDQQSTKYIDLLILNDIYYPIDELTKNMSDSLNYLEARNLLNSIEESEINYLYGDLINPSREKMVEDYKTFKNRLSRSAIVLLEGNDYPGGSQTLFVKRQLERDGFICLLDLKQSVWIRR
jgi:hypothetical protein